MLGVAAFYFISAGLIMAGIASGFLPEGTHGFFIVVWAGAGLALAALKIASDWDG